MMEAYVVVLQIRNKRMPTGSLLAFGPRKGKNEIVWITVGVQGQALLGNFDFGPFLLVESGTVLAQT